MKAVLTHRLAGRHGQDRSRMNAKSLPFNFAKSRQTLKRLIGFWFSPRVKRGSDVKCLLS